VSLVDVLRSFAAAARKGERHSSGDDVALASSLERYHGGAAARALQAAWAPHQTPIMQEVCRQVLTMFGR